MPKLSRQQHRRDDRQSGGDQECGETKNGAVEPAGQGLAQRKTNAQFQRRKVRNRAERVDAQVGAEEPCRLVVQTCFGLDHRCAKGLRPAI